MKLFNSIVVLMLVSHLSGCASFESLRIHSAKEELPIYPGLQTFEYERSVIYYKDLSDPCDQQTIAWADSSVFTPIQPVGLHVKVAGCVDKSEVKKAVAYSLVEQISIPFSMRQSSLTHGAKALSQLTLFVDQPIEFHIQGAAGSKGAKSEALGLARASTVRDHLVGLGVAQDRIFIMPYDPDVPGLQALVKVVEPVLL